MTCTSSSKIIGMSLLMHGPRATKTGVLRENQPPNLSSINEIGLGEAPCLAVPQMPPRPFRCDTLRETGCEMASRPAGRGAGGGWGYS